MHILAQLITQFYQDFYSIGLKESFASLARDTNTDFVMFTKSIPLREEYIFHIWAWSEINYLLTRKQNQYMHVAIITFGSRGDVQPYIALGVGLRRAGHSVCIITHAPFAEFVNSYDLDFYALDDERSELFQTPVGQALLVRGTNPLAFAMRYAHYTNPRIHDYMKKCRMACQDADVIICSLLAVFYACSIGEKMGIRVMAAFLQPTQIPTNAFAEPANPHFILPLLDTLKDANYYSHTITRALYWRLFSRTINAARHDVLGLPPYGKQSPLKAIETGCMPLLCGFSPLVLPKPDDWGANVHVTGFWHLDYHSTWQPTDELQRFLAAGPAPVYVGFGSMQNSDPEATTKLVVDALARARQRGILLTGWQGLARTRLPETVLAVDAVPHAWLFPRMAAIVHHGGAGTTGESLRAGIPTITIPFISDQPFWGRRVYELGAGPLPIPRAKLSADRLASALCTAVQDQRMRQRAAAIGQRLQAEDGVQQAIRAFQRLLDI